ncbi:MAG: hypothetical protein AB7F64_06510 [Gammaproteobacteria bacterium]
MPNHIHSHIQLIQANSSSAVNSISQSLVEASEDKYNPLYPLAMAISLHENDNINNNLRHYLFLLLALLHYLNNNIDLNPLRVAVENISFKK